MINKHIATFYAAFIRTWLKTLRRPVALTFSLFQPLMWMLFFGFLFHRYTVENMPPGLEYLDFLVPGICAMTVLFGASQSGIELIRDIQSKFLTRVTATPAAKSMILGGKITADVSRLLIQSFIVLVLGLALGTKLNFSFLSLAQMIVNLTLFGIAFCSLSCLIALKAKSQENMATFVHIVNMPILFTSTALVPNKQMPEWLAHIAHYNPLSLVVDNIRSSLVFGKPVCFGYDLMLLTGLTGGLLVLSVWAFRTFYLD